MDVWVKSLKKESHRSLIIVEKGTEVGTKSLPRKPYGDQRGNKGTYFIINIWNINIHVKVGLVLHKCSLFTLPAGPSYKSHVALSVTVEQVAIACPIA